MNFMLTLEHLALAKIAITLWSQEDVKNCTNKSFESLKSNWQEIVEAVIDKSSKLSLPEILKEKLSCFTVPVGLQLLSWLDLHSNQYGLVRVLPATLIWTSLGTIDYKRTAEVLLKDKSLSIRDSFIVACIYCLEDDIRGLWDTFSLRENGYTNLLKDPTYKGIYALKSYLYLLSFWAHHMEESLDEWQRYVIKNYKIIPGRCLTPYLCVLKLSAELRNVVAYRYFLKKLNSTYEADIREESTRKVALLLKSGKHEHDVHLCGFRRFSSNVVIFHLSTSNAQQQSEIFKHHTYHVLTCLIDWPWHNLLLETINNNWDFLSQSSYGYLLHRIVDKMSYKLNYVSELFREVWQRSPEAYKQYIIEGYDFGSLLLELCKKEDETNIQLILKDSSISARRKVVHELDFSEFLFSCKNINLVQCLMKNLYDKI